MKMSEGLGREPEPRGIPLPLLLKACPEIRAYAGTDPRTWHELAALADRLRGYMGIAAPIWAEARLRMGPDLASATLAAMLLRFRGLRNPGGDLRRLAQRHTEERLGLDSMVYSLLGKQEDAS